MSPLELGLGITDRDLLITHVHVTPSDWSQAATMRSRGADGIVAYDCSP